MAAQLPAHLRVVRGILRRLNYHLNSSPQKSSEPSSEPFDAARLKRAEEALHNMPTPDAGAKAYLEKHIPRLARTLALAPPPGATFNGQSCEWIMEAPDSGEPTSSLPRFTPVTFTSALACGPNNATANPQSGDIMNIATSGGKILTSTTVGSDTTTISFVG